LITFKLEVKREEDGRWLAEVLEMPGVLAYGESQDAAVSKAGPQLPSIPFAAA
jgi:predicted RNase H-like HicB family nuclease